MKKDDGTKDSMDKWSRCLEFEITLFKVKTKFGGLNVFKPEGKKELEISILVC